MYDKNVSLYIRIQAQKVYWDPFTGESGQSDIDNYEIDIFYEFYLSFQQLFLTSLI